MLKLALVIVVLMSTLVSAGDCNFTGRVHLDKTDLAPFFTDQVGCGLQKMMSGMDILIILCVIFLVVILIYSLWRKK